MKCKACSDQEAHPVYGELCEDCWVYARSAIFVSPVDGKEYAGVGASLLARDDVTGVETHNPVRVDAMTISWGKGRHRQKYRRPWTHQ